MTRDSDRRATRRDAQQARAAGSQSGGDQPHRPDFTPLCIAEHLAWEGKGNGPSR
jgi:hypothetical protein